MECKHINREAGQHSANAGMCPPVPRTRLRAVTCTHVAHERFVVSLSVSHITRILNTANDKWPLPRSSFTDRNDADNVKVNGRASEARWRSVDTNPFPSQQHG